MALQYLGRLATIAGGIGGLGSTTAHRLHSNGAEVVLLYAPLERDRVKETLNKAFGSESPERVHTFETDITSEPCVKDVFNQITELDTKAFPSILVNAAGYVSVQHLEETSADEALKNLLPNVLGPLNCSNAFFHLYTRKAAKLQNPEKKVPGRIVSIASQAAHVALDGHGAYCASKAGLLGLVRCQASE